MLNGKLFSSKSTKLNCTTQCGACGLYRNCKSPKLKEIGNNHKNIMLIRGVPTKNDDNLGQPFSEDSYAELYPIFKEQGIDLYEDCILMDVISCFVNPYKQPKELNAALDYCYPTLRKAILTYKPKIVFLCGFDAVKAVIGREYKKDLNDIDMWRGWNIPNQEFQCYYSPIFDPHDVNRILEGESKKNKNLYKITSLIMKQDIQRSLSLLDMEFPDYRKLKDCVHVLNEEQTLEWIAKAKIEMKDMLKRGEHIYWMYDLETNMLKPHNKNAKIYSCSISYKNNESVAFRWTKKISSALAPLFRSKIIRHMAHNIKFDMAWLHWVEGIDLGNPYFDSLIAAHILDARKNITGLKFQAYINFGVGDYNSNIKQYLEADTSYTENRIFECKESEMLFYDGLDSLYARMLAMKQMKILDMLN